MIRKTVCQFSPGMPSCFERGELQRRQEQDEHPDETLVQREEQLRPEQGQHEAEHDLRHRIGGGDGDEDSGADGHEHRALRRLERQRAALGLAVSIGDGDRRLLDKGMTRHGSGGHRLAPRPRSQFCAAGRSVAMASSAWSARCERR